MNKHSDSIISYVCFSSRHVALAAGPSFTESMWQITVDSFEKAMNVTTYSIRQIMILFHPNSENFYGDIGQVKVATRKDCSPMELERLYQLAQQVRQAIHVILIQCSVTLLICIPYTAFE